MGVRTGRHGGVLITFEGVEGGGKTTQLSRLAKLLREAGYRVVETREPGGTPAAERIREILLTDPAARQVVEPISPTCEAFLIMACRSQHVAQVIQPALREDAIVLCDRFSDSTLAYQGYGRGLDLNWLRKMDRAASHGITPDLTLLMDLPVSSGLARRRRFEAHQNRLDQESQQFHERVGRGFRALARRHPRRIKVIDAQQDPDRVAMEIADAVEKFLSRSRKSKLSRRGRNIRKV